MLFDFDTLYEQWVNEVDVVQFSIECPVDRPHEEVAHVPAGDGDGGHDGDGQREVDGPRESQEGRGEERGRGQDGRRKGGFLFLSFFVIICNIWQGGLDDQGGAGGGGAQRGV